MSIKRILIIGWLSITISLSVWNPVWADSKGLDRVIKQSHQNTHIIVKNHNGLIHTVYQKSYALVIGVSDYTNGWPDLNSVPDEIKRVQTALSSLGFSVTTLVNPDSKSLENGLDSFIKTYGFNLENRLLIFYSGHGYTRKNGNKGYLVPSNSPNPLFDETGFLQSALPMTRILAWSREIESKHVLFLFDSCFSGTVFKTKALPEEPRHITHLTALPVRQYITSGSAGEEVPAKSVFTPMFVDALKDGSGDLDKDGYITGSELGMYLQSQIPKFTPQTPQYVKINDYDLSRGDFVFEVQKKEIASTQVAVRTKTQFSMTKPVVVTKIKDFKKKYPFYVGLGVYTLSTVQVATNTEATIASAGGKYADRKTIYPVIFGYERRFDSFKFGGEAGLLLSSDIQGLSVNAIVHRYLGHSHSVYAYIGVNGFKSHRDTIEFYAAFNRPCDWGDSCDSILFPVGGLGLQLYLYKRFSFRGEYYLGTLSKGWMGSALLHF